MGSSPWLPFGAQPGADVRLLCLPHAGAGASVFRDWGRGLDPRIGVVPVQPPGREKRRREAPFASIGPLVDDLIPVITESAQGPYAMFGHSTGALVVFATVCGLRAAGGPMPAHLFVSGRPAPQTPLRRDDVAAMSLPELAVFLKSIGGTSDEVLGNPDILAALQPILAADFALNQGYVHVPGPPLEIPITAFAGVEDSGADPALMEQWREQTTAEFVLRTLAGGHFAAFEQKAEIHTRIAEQLADHLH